MKLRKFGQISLAAVVTSVLALGTVSCRNDYTSAFLFTVGTQYNQIGSYRVSYETGKLTPAPGSPFGSGGTNPTRGFVLSGGRYIYVLNHGAEQTDSTTSAISYTGANVSLFAVGGSGTLSYQANYSSQGSNTIRILPDSSGKFLFALDTYTPVLSSGGTFSSTFAPQSSQSSAYPCLNPSDGKYYPTGGITVFTIDPNTGRLAIVLNQQQQATPPGGGTPVSLTYFPVGCFPVDFSVASGYIFTAQSGSTSNSDVQTVFPYQLNSANGQLTLTQNSALAMGTQGMSAISTAQGSTLSGSKYVYILDAAANSGSGVILPFTVGTNGILQALASASAQNDSTASNPTTLVVDSTGKFLYVANSGPTTGIVNPISQITGWTIDPTTGALQHIAGEPYGSGSGVNCILQDPSNQYVYTTSFNDSQITGRIFDPKSGSLTLLRSGSTFNTVGNPTWCMVSGRTN